MGMTSHKIRHLSNLLSEAHAELCSYIMGFWRIADHALQKGLGIGRDDLESVCNQANSKT